MEKSKLVKTNVLISIILVLGFLLTAIFSYRANYEDSIRNMERVSALTADGIYYQLSMLLTKPVHVSLTMSRDSLLSEHLEREAEESEEAYIKTTMEYLQAYQETYEFDSVFLISDATGRYYSYQGLDRTMSRENPDDAWYYNLVEGDREYSVEVASDEVEGADHAVTVFVDCKVEDSEGNALGVVGVGLRIDTLKQMMQEYKESFAVDTYLVNDDGMIEISGAYAGHERADWFETYDREHLREEFLGWKKGSLSLNMWTDLDGRKPGRSYMLVRYIPELSWHLIVEQNTGALITEINHRIFLMCFFVLAVIVTVLAVITTVIRKFNQQILELREERQEVFKKVTEQLYDNIYELNITKNCAEGERTEEYFATLGARGMPYDQVLGVIAQKQIKEEFRKGYIETFHTENILREFEKGNCHLQYEFMITQDGANFFWMRIDSYAFYFEEDQCVHMFTYRKNIESEKKKELKSQFDEMTGFYTKVATERIIGMRLRENPDMIFALFIFDIDNFKQANDQFGHAFGDLCIDKFTKIIKKNFRERDILGRIGGDEFAAFIPVSGRKAVEEKVRELSAELETICIDGACVWSMSASIGVAIAPKDGADFETLYKNADKALYEAKKRGKDGFFIHHE